MLKVTSLPDTFIGYKFRLWMCIVQITVCYVFGLIKKCDYKRYELTQEPHTKRPFEHLLCFVMLCPCPRFCFCFCFKLFNVSMCCAMDGYTLPFASPRCVQLQSNSDIALFWWKPINELFFSFSSVFAFIFGFWPIVVRHSWATALHQH